MKPSVLWGLVAYAAAAIAILLVAGKVFTPTPSPTVNDVVPAPLVEMGEPVQAPAPEIAVEVHRSRRTPRAVTRKRHAATTIPSKSPRARVSRTVNMKQEKKTKARAPEPKATSVVSAKRTSTPVVVYSPRSRRSEVDQAVTYRPSVNRKPAAVVYRPSASSRRSAEFPARSRTSTVVEYDPASGTTTYRPAQRGPSVDGTDQVDEVERRNPIRRKPQSQCR